MTFMGLRKKGRMENWRTALGNDIRGAPDSKVEETRIAIGNDINGAPKKVENGGLHLRVHT